MGPVLCRAVPRILLPAGVAVLVGLAGCGTGQSGGQETAPTPIVSPSVDNGRTGSPTEDGVPAGGVSLRQLGFQHGPDGMITVPEDIRIALRVDQPNMVTVTFSAPEGRVIGEWLSVHLRDGGYRVTAESADGVVFEGYAWSGAFTVHPAGSALTLRRSPDGPAPAGE